VSSMCTSWFHTGRYRVPQIYYAQQEEFITLYSWTMRRKVEIALQL
jgi:hypothetical protein